MKKLQVERLSSLYIWGAEEVLAGNSMIYRIRFREPIFLEKVWRSYQKLVLERAELRIKLVARDKTKSFHWEQLDEAETQALLKKEELSLSQFTSQEALESEYSETNSHLPFRIAVGDDHTLFLIVNHVFTNGRGGIYWFREWLIRYQQKDPSQAQQAGGNIAPKPFAILRMARAITGFFWVFIYLIQFLLRAGKDAKNSTIDLTHGRKCSQNDKGYSSRSYVFSQETTDILKSHVRKQGHSMSVELTAIIARAFFDQFPHKHRILISIPTDLREKLPWITGSAPGNFTGSLIMQLSRNSDLVSQIKREFKWIKRGIPYYLPRFMASIQNEFQAKENFRKQSTTTISDRAPFENFTFALSNPGRISFPELEESCEWMSGHAKTQTIFLSICEACGRFSMEAGISNALFDKEEVFEITDNIAAQIREIRQSEQEA